jgi:hypothetical protein
MSKAEKFIQDYTRNCSNEYDLSEYFENGIERLKEYQPWLSPDQALRAAEIAREEAIDDVIKWLKKNATYTHPRKGTKECIVNIAKLKDDLRNQ